MEKFECPVCNISDYHIEVSRTHIDGLLRITYECLHCGSKFDVYLWV